MNVLSLFDGMSCGQIALNKLGIKYDKYFASEINKPAMEVALKNYPDTIQIGDVTKVTVEDLPEISLLIGGSPCQGFSMAGKKLNFDDPRSKLFFEYVRLLKECKPKWFLLENVKMKKEFEKVISEHLGVEPILINSALVSAQRRERLYWTNIPFDGMPDDKGILLKDIIEFDAPERRYVDLNRIHKTWDTPNYLQYDISGNGHKSQDQRAFRLEGKHGTISASGAKSKVKALLDDGRIIHLLPMEAERLQTVPDGYTEGVSESQRFSMLGNGWTVDVITHLLKGIKE